MLVSSRLRRVKFLPPLSTLFGVFQLQRESQLNLSFEKTACFVPEGNKSAKKRMNKVQHLILLSLISPATSNLLCLFCLQTLTRISFYHSITEARPANFSRSHDLSQAAI